MSPLAPGLLIAAPPLGDPNFDRSVVLLAEHGSQGAFGWVLNGPDIMTVEDLLHRAEFPDAVDIEGTVRIGGPVAQEQVWLIYRTEEQLADVDGQFEVCAGVTATASRGVLEAVADGRMPPSLFGIVGYAGWAPSQLEEEIRAGAWLPTDVVASMVFDVPRAKLWTRAYERMGTSPMAFTTRVVGSA